MEKLTKEIAAIAVQMKLTRDEHSYLREFIVKNVEEQHRAGQRAGIRWARLNPVK